MRRAEEEADAPAGGVADVTLGELPNAWLPVGVLDDDGETAAGGRLLRLLVLADARDVVVVVSRWYGGIHLGPARFHVINACAKDALVALGEIHQ